MRLLAIAVVGITGVAPGCARLAEADSPRAPATAPAAPPVPQVVPVAAINPPPALPLAPPPRLVKWERQLTLDVRYVTRVDCGTCAASSSYYGPASERIRSAGPEILPIYAEALGEPRHRFPENLVSMAAAAGLRHPYSAPFRAALRARRDACFRQDGYIRPDCTVCTYFVRHGDESDLDWLRTITARVSESYRPHGERFVRELAARLVTN